MNAESNPMSPDAAFVICVEKGPLEYKALCLITTLRKNWGRWSSLPIYAYSPRAGREVSAWLLEVYAALGVTPVLKDLNRKYRDYPLANKPLAMADAEQSTTHETLVFLDSDILCWREPHLFALPAGKSIGMTVDTTKAVASAGPDDPNEAMWQQLYKVFGASSNVYITTSLDEQRVRGWWGSGVIATRRSAGLMKSWLDGFEKAMACVDFLPAAAYLREQMTLSALVVAHHEKFQELPIAYNYQVQNHRHFSRRGTNADTAVLWHYQPYFDRAFTGFAKQLDKLSSLEARLDCADRFTNRLSLNYPRMIGTNEPRLMALRRRLNLGNRVRSLFGRS